MNTSFVEAILAAGAIVTALVVVGRLVVNAANGIHAIQEAIGTDSEGKTLAQRHQEQGKLLTEMDQRLTTVERVLSPPGQDTLPTRVDKVEEEIDEVRNEVRSVGAKVDTLTVLVRKDIEGRDQ